MFGPWKGLMQWPGEATAQHCEDGWNLAFEGNDIISRPGRVPYSSGNASVGAISGMWRGASVDPAILCGGATITNGLDEAALWLWDPRTDDYLPVELPEDAKVTSPVSVWNFVPWENTVIGCNGEGPIIYLKDGKAEILGATRGVLANEAGKAYLPSPPEARHLSVYRNKLFVGGFRSDPRTVYHSEYGNAYNLIPSDGTAPMGGANLWPAYNVFQVGDPGEVEMGMGVVADRLAIFTDRSVWVFDIDSLQIAEKNHGCMAPRSICNVAGVLVYLSNDGIRTFNGQSSTLISHPIQPTLDRWLNKGNLSKAIGVHVPSKHQYRLYVPLNGSLRNRMCIVWDYVANVWSLWGGTPYWMEPQAGVQEMEVSSAITLSVGDDEYLVTGDYGGMLWCEDHGDTDAGNPLVWYAASKRIGWEDQSIKTFRDLRIQARGTGVPVKYAVMKDGDEMQQTVGLSSGLFKPHADTFSIKSEDTLLWSDAVDGASPAIPGYMPLRVALNANARTMQLVLWHDGHLADGSTAGGTLALRGLDIETRPQDGGRR
jgi:hypothetical protein